MPGRHDAPVRIIAGSRKGHRIDAPKGRATRPTSDRVRENVFNLVAPWVEDAVVLDLFAGSGAMGIEALSRGAERAVFVESHARRVPRDRAQPRQASPHGRAGRRAATSRASSPPTRARTTSSSATRRTTSTPTLEPPLARYVPRLLAEDGLLVLETAAKTEPQLPLEQRTSRRYGAARITLFHR